MTNQIGASIELEALKMLDRFANKPQKPAM
jgi:hypothetical protein